MSFDASPSQNWNGSQQSDDNDVVLETIHAGLEQDLNQNTDPSMNRGGCSGVEVLRRIRSLCNLLVGPQHQQHSSYKIANTLDHSFPRHLLCMYSIQNVQLPAMAEMNRLLGIAFSRVGRLWPFIDRALVERNVERLYDISGSGRVDPDDRGLIYALVALGQRYDSRLRPTNSDSFVIGMCNG